MTSIARIFSRDLVGSFGGGSAVYRILPTEDNTD
jgi:hypothetical protein